MYFFATVALLNGQIAYSLLCTHSSVFGQVDVSDAQTGASDETVPQSWDIKDSDELASFVSCWSTDTCSLG